MSSFVEVLPPELTGPNHSEWFEARRAGVTASEIAGIMGLSPWDSPFSIFWRKRDVLGEQDDTDATEWGRRLESLVAEKFLGLHSEFDFHPGRLVAHKERSWQLATPDYLLTDATVAGEHEGDPVALLEVKTAYSWDEWGPEGTDEVPLHYRAQVLWQLDTTGLDVAYLAVLVGGRSYREYVVAADPDDAAVMRAHAVGFLAAVESGTPPPVDGSDATLRALRILHADLDDTEAQVPTGLAESYRRAVRAARKADAHKKTVEARLRDRMGRSRVAVDRRGDKVVTRSIYTVKEHVRAESTVDKLTLPKETR